jgi:hypothetical protein
LKKESDGSVVIWKCGTVKLDISKTLLWSILGLPAQGWVQEGNLHSRSRIFAKYSFGARKLRNQMG